MSTRRISKVNALIAQLFSELLSREVGLPLDILCTVSKVDTSPDLRYTTVFLSIYPENKVGSTLTLIRKKLPSIQKDLCRRLTLRIVPKISLVNDSTEKEAQEVETLLQQIQREQTYERPSSSNRSKKTLS